MRVRYWREAAALGGRIRGRHRILTPTRVAADFLGSQIESEVSVQNGFNYRLEEKLPYEAPPIHIWIFSIQVGINASASLTTSGSVQADGFYVKVVPELSAGCHVFGGIDVYVASGGVDATIQLLTVSVPVEGSLTWSVSTDPAVCATRLNFAVDANLEVGALGGAVDLVATLGPCPFCWDERFNLFSWDPIDVGSQKLFHIPGPDEQLDPVPLPESLCRMDLEATIQYPPPNLQVYTNIPVDLIGGAKRPASAVAGGEVSQPTLIADEYLTWTVEDASDGFPPLKGHSQSVTFLTPGTRTITLAAADKYGETGSDSVTITVVEPPAGELKAYIQSPQEGYNATDGLPVRLTGGPIGGNEPFTILWLQGEEIIGSGREVMWQPTLEYHTATLMVRDSSDPPQTAFASVTVLPPPDVN